MPHRVERRRFGLAARLTVLLGAVAGVGILVMSVYVSRALEEQAVGRLQGALVTQAGLLQDVFAPLLDASPKEAVLQARAQRYARILGARLTLIAADGTVLAESDRDFVREMENHVGRPEVRQALDGRIGSDVRRSATLGRDLLYVAVPLERPGKPRTAIRLALPTQDVDEARALVRRTVIGGGFLAVCVAVVLGLFVSRRVTRPLRGMEEAARRMAEGDLAQTVPVAGTDEIAELGVALNRTAVALREKIERLGDEQAKVRTILDGMIEGVVALDDRGRLLFLNPAARAMFGVENGTPEGRSFLEVIRQKGLLDLVNEVRASDAPARHELELGPPVNRVVAARGAPLGLGPDASGVLLVLHDVTELRRLERVRSEFVANVSHELRTPLTCIKGYLETLLDGALDDQAYARRFLEVAGTHAERLDRLIDDLLELTNIESGRVTLVPMSLDLGDVVAGVAAMFERQTTQSGQTLERVVPAGLTVHADRDRLVQILVNLVDNAVKFTPEGGQIRIESEAGPDGRVEVRVCDTGIGIPSTDLPRITERFYRVDKTRSREIGGTGLGLAIVKHLVQAHGGELRIESTLGHGTTVSFTLPAGEGATTRCAPAPGAARRAPSPPAGPGARPGPRRGRVYAPPWAGAAGRLRWRRGPSFIGAARRFRPSTSRRSWSSRTGPSFAPTAFCRPICPSATTRCAHWTASPRGVSSWRRPNAMCRRTCGRGDGRSSSTRSVRARAGGSATSPISGGSLSGRRPRSGRAWWS